MAVIASWKNKKWEVSPSKIYNLEGFSTSFKLKVDQNQDKEGSPATNVRGRELVPLSFDVTLSDVVGINVRAEIESWAALIGEAAPFYLGGKRFGPELMQLQSVDVSDVIIDDLGRIRSAKLRLSFEEYADEAAKAKPGATPTSTLDIGPNSQDKASKKPANPQLAQATSTGMVAGAKVRIVGNNYATGQKVPQWVKDKTHVISKVSGEKALLGANGGINSWVYIKDLSLV